MTTVSFTENKEWNAKIISVEQGEVSKELSDELELCHIFSSKKVLTSVIYLL